MSTVPVPLVFGDYALEDRYRLDKGRVYLTGIQALVRLPMMQRQRDLAAGLNTAGFISGYRGSPLGGVDQALWKAQEHLERHNIKFQPGVNEELAATAVWGTQQVNLFPGAKYDGVFAHVVRQGPGRRSLRRRVQARELRRHVEARRRARCSPATTTAAKSSTLPHQSEHEFAAAMIPVLYPAGVQEILDLGLHGFAMSRYLGLLGRLQGDLRHRRELGVASTSIRDRVDIVVPDDFAAAAGRRSTSAGPTRRSTRKRGCTDYKIYAALAIAAPTGSTASSSIRRRRALGIIDHRQELPRRAARRSTTSASTRPRRARSASACTRSACPGRSSPTACASSPRGSRKSWSSRRSARSSSTR